MTIVKISAQLCRLPEQEQNKSQHLNITTSQHLNISTSYLNTST
ncbi:MAG: hypothetical protein UDK33_00920 [Prevotella sp.]|nr:hypothetical protein [Prevotella sp.]